SDYLSERMKSSDPEKASASGEIAHGDVSRFFSSGSETTHYSVVDPYGNAVSATTTLNGTYGNFTVVDSAGFLLNNEMDDFSVKPGIPNIYGLTGGQTNSVQPGKRMLSSMTPTIVEKQGRLFLVLGSPGGSTIPTSVLQVIINVIDFGMNISDAVSAGRFHHQWLPDHISYEQGGIPEEVVGKLKSLGHQVIPVSSLGRVNAVMLLDDGKKASGADKRGDNSACGY
ncbi:MAG: gamma-glutamyltransferase, partial [Bacteroidales bacterium]|nr:gamma-glutamyltransferase [Bacteroidales bacterium]